MAEAGRGSARRLGPQARRTPASAGPAFFARPADRFVAPLPAVVLGSADPARSWLDLAMPGPVGVAFSVFSLRFRPVRLFFFDVRFGA